MPLYFVTESSTGKRKIVKNFVAQTSHFIPKTRKFVSNEAMLHLRPSCKNGGTINKG